MAVLNGEKTETSGDCVVSNCLGQTVDTKLHVFRKSWDLEISIY